MKKISSLPKIPRRRRDGHKGDYGHVLVVGGSHGMAGAPCLAGEAALRAGAGLVTVAVPRGIYPIVAAKLTCCMTHALEEGEGGGLDDRQTDAVLEYCRRFDVIALGPGIGRAPETSRFARALVARAPQPTIVDADGLNAIAEDASILASAQAARILTPHPGEMARLAGLGSPGTRYRIASPFHDRLRAAAEFATEFRVILVLKGYRTIVTDGSRYFVNETGNPGMATGGSGDVLTGVIAALLGQKFEPFDAAQLGVYLHGLAGDLAARRLGEISLTAWDVLMELPAAFLKHTRSR